MALFDAYVMVDWSAASKPRRGLNSIWVAVHERLGAAMVEHAPVNPPTRAAAAELLADLLADLSARGRRTLLGCDFNFAFPRGFAARLNPGRPDWRGVWNRLARLVEDRPDNANNRFALAARLNAEISGGAFPFWGCPPGAETATLSRTRPAAIGDLPERRLVEARARRTQPAWKLFTAGSVGSQSLLGIPRLLALSTHAWLNGRVKVWPFETGLAPLARPEEGGIVLAEVYPSLVPVPAGPIRDALQVTALARHFAQLDGAGQLGDLFAGDPALTPAKLNRSAAIMRRSFAIIRREAELGRFTGAMEDVALRVIHACGMPDIIRDLVFSPGAAEAGRAALAAGKPIFVDVKMVAHGIIRRRLPAANLVVCRLDDPAAVSLARTLRTTRSAAAVTLWGTALDGAVAAIGNAPTALFKLLDLLAAGEPWPAVVLGFAVGFVGAVEAKEALIASGLPHICLRGRRGGSAMAAAALNALAGGTR
jgi:precorrin-8X/cobalt-precorrin-8 methylmutase